MTLELLAPTRVDEDSTYLSHSTLSKVNLQGLGLKQNRRTPTDSVIGCQLHRQQFNLICYICLLFCTTVVGAWCDRSMAKSLSCNCQDGIWALVHILSALFPIQPLLVAWESSKGGPKSWDPAAGQGIWISSALANCGYLESNPVDGISFSL